MPRVRAIESWPEYFRSFGLTLALIEKLEAFARGGREPEVARDSGRQARWAEDDTQAGPIRANITATGILLTCTTLTKEKMGQLGSVNRRCAERTRSSTFAT